MDDAILKVKDLNISFSTAGGRVQAVRDVSFHLERGKTLAIVGESGSGKSVTAKAILGILADNAAVEGGEILFEGEDLLKLDEKSMHKIRGDKIAMIFQNPMSALNPIVKIGKQLTEAMLLKNKGTQREVLTKAMAKARGLELMREVGITDPEKRFDQYPFEFSGGMRQRIVIAIALAANPALLICDEPTTALDVTIQAQILELIHRLKRERKLSVIFITHDLGVVANMADHVAVMYAGKIVEYGTVEEIFYDPRHPYTWALLSSMPDLETRERLESIPGTPPNMIAPPPGDAFAPRNKYALEIDFELQPPPFFVSPTHWAATWLLHPDAPKAELPKIITRRMEKMQKSKGADGE